MANLRRLSKRSTDLLVIGGMWILYGLMIRPLPTSAGLPLWDFIPMHWQSTLWIISGALCALAVIIPRAPRSIGFGAAPFMPLAWTCGFLALAIRTPTETTFEQAAFWALISYLVMRLAGAEEVA